MQKDFDLLIHQISPRIFSQICLDPSSNAYGACDRNWWHYKMRDFPSIILQQGAYYLAVVSTLRSFSYTKEQMQKAAIAGVDFWHQRAVRFGAFEEYYPYEQGYPAMAFSTLAISKTIRDLALPIDKYHKGLKVAIAQAQKREEFEASNQYLAGLASLFVIHNMRSTWVDIEKAKDKLYTLLKKQNPEGWFNEYGGPDLGYLSVSLDCLWDIHDCYPDSQVLSSIKKAVKFIDSVLIDNASIGMHNSRNTDYVVPYGIIRACRSEDQDLRESAIRLANRLYGNLANSDHFTRSIDDRYWIHYIGHSFARAYRELLEHGDVFAIEDALKPQQTLRIDEILPPDEKHSRGVFYKESGYYIYKTAYYHCIVSTQKGGNISVVNGNYTQRFSDYGMLFNIKNTCYVMNWWGNSAMTKQIGNKLVIQGDFVSTKQRFSNPLSHIVLRICSVLFGPAIIALLKKQFIFRKPNPKYGFIREITLGEDEIDVYDTITGVTEPGILQKAPRSSKRHVSSAGSFHPEDFILNTGCTLKTNITKDEKGIHVSHQIRI